MKVKYTVSAPRTLALAALCASLFLLVQSAQAQIPSPSSSPQPGSPTAATPGTAPAPEGVDSRYRIGPDDVLEVRVFNRPQLSRESVRVDGRGMIRMPLIEGDVQAACKTESELSAELAKGYLEYLKNPQVEVFVKEFNSKPVSVVGAVAHPARFQLQRKVRLLELITLAGGPTEAAGRFVQVIRSDRSVSCDDGEADAATPGSAGGVISVELSQVLQGNEQANPFVEGGDVVSVPDGDQIFVVGNVYKPTNIPLRAPVTVSYAIAQAGGMLDDSNREQVRIIRQVPGSPTKQQIIANLTAIRKDGAVDVPLQAGDIVEVPISNKSRFKRVLTYTLAPALIYMPTSVIR
jgi:polysaccharide biosynthesis/export protein